MTNTSLGTDALASVTTGSFNTALGAATLSELTTSRSNTAVGASSQEKVTGGKENSSVGVNSLRYLTSGFNNTAIGIDALNLLLTGSYNTAVGSGAGARSLLSSSIKATKSTYIGANAANSDAGDYSYVTAVGADSKVAGRYASTLGYNTQALQHGSVAIGTDSTGVGASVTDPDTIQLGTDKHDVVVLGRLRITSVSPSVQMPAGW